MWGALRNGTSFQPFLYYDKKIHPLEAPENDSVDTASINDFGITTGSVLIDEPGLFRQDAFVWDRDGHATDLGDAPAGSPSFSASSGSIAGATNLFGITVGEADDDAVYWKNGRGYSLPDANGAPCTEGYASGVNIFGEICGLSDANTGGVATVWDRNHVAYKLPFLDPNYPESNAESINDSGDVVGGCEIGVDSPFFHAALFHKGVAYDLAKLVPANSGVQLIQADYINNRGQILCRGTTNDGATILHYILTPVRDK